MNTLEQAALSGALTTIHLRNSPDPDGLEPVRVASDPEDDDGEEEYADAMPLQDDDDLGDSAAIMSRGWSGNTGPKGVLLDFKASHGKSGAILGGNEISAGPPTNSRRSTTNKKSQPGSHSETDSESDKELRHSNLTSSIYTGGRRTHRIVDKRSAGFSIGMHARKTSTSSPPSISPIINGSNARSWKTDSHGRKLFGHLREVGVDNFIQAVEAEKDDKETVVLVHLYDPALDSCALLNNHLSSLARLYPRTKFLRALASELDFFNSSSSPSTGNHRRDFSFPSIPERDSFESGRGLLIDTTSSYEVETEERRRRKPTDTDILPTLLWYRAGEYVQSLPAMERELPGGVIKRGEKGCAELHSLLSKYGIIQ